MSARCCGCISIAFPRLATGDSCIFHGKQGCTLDRSLRADICNVYYCGGLGSYMKTGAAVPVKVIAGEGDKMRASAGADAVDWEGL